jgi:NADH-quinone oxidoreductase subunit E
MSLAFSQKAEERFQELLTRYPNKQAPLIQVLHIAQEEFGYISVDVQKYVAERLGLPVAHVYGVVTFYTMFHQKPVGKYFIEICTSLSCEIMGVNKIADHCKKKLGINFKQTTADGRITLAEAECLAACGGAPCLQVNGIFHEKVTVESVDQLLDGLK